MGLEDRAEMFLHVDAVPASVTVAPGVVDARAGSAARGDAERDRADALSEVEQDRAEHAHVPVLERDGVTDDTGPTEDRREVERFGRHLERGVCVAREERGEVLADRLLGGRKGGPARARGL